MAKVEDHTEDTPKDGGVPLKLGGILSGLGTLVEKLGELAETGEKLSQSGEFKDAAGRLRGVYGINVKTGLGDRGQQELKVEPFGNVHPKKPGKPGKPAEDVREPLVDVHEEEDHVLVLAEIPGASEDNVQVELAGDQLNIEAKRGETRYRKEVVLPESFAKDQMEWNCKNGILQIRLQR